MNAQQHRFFSCEESLSQVFLRVLSFNRNGAYTPQPFVTSLLRRRPRVRARAIPTLRSFNAERVRVRKGLSESEIGFKWQWERLQSERVWGFRRESNFYKKSIQHRFLNKTNVASKNSTSVFQKSILITETQHRFLEKIDVNTMMLTLVSEKSILALLTSIFSTINVNEFMLFMNMSLHFS